MSLNCGIVGLPNVGKSTLFSALTSSKAEVANYPFCTIDPNVGVVNVPDKRLQQISDIVIPERVLPTICEFVDIAGLVKGASQGEGLGNQFLGHIRQVGAILHVVRCFENDDIIHVHGRINPLDDIQTINVELCLSDLETVDKRLSSIDKLIKSQDKVIQTNAKRAKPVLEKLQVELQKGNPARSLELDIEDREAINDLHLITLRPQVYICNVDEEGLQSDNEHVKSVRKLAESERTEVVVICGELERELSCIEDSAERAELMESVGIVEAGLDKLIKTSYQMLGLRTYFTAGKKEVRAWTFHEGMKAPQCAGIIHSDFEKGFIKAEVYSCVDLFELGSEVKVKEAGKMRMEGKEYIVKDGDIMHFRFNV